MENLRILKATDLDPEYKDIADDIADTLILSAQRALISVVDPRMANMPSAPGSFEQLSLAYMKSIDRNALHPRKVRMPRNNKFHTLVDKPRFQALDLKSDRSIYEQIYEREGTNLSQPLTLKPDLINKGASNLLFRINGLYCQDETNSLLNDYIKMQAVVTDGMGNSYTTGQLDLERDWDTGESNNWKADGEPKPLVNFNLDFGKGWPRTYTAVITMSEGYESDGMKKLANLMGKVMDKVEEKLVEYLKNKFGALAAAKVGALIGSPGGILGIAIGAVIGAIVGAVIAYVIDKLFDWFKEVLIETKLFTPIPFAFTIPYSGYKLSNEYIQNLTWTDHNSRFVIPVEAILQWGNANNELSALTQENKKIQSVFKVNNDNKILCSWYGNKVWIDTQGMASVDSIITPIVNKGSKELYIFVIGMDNKVWYSRSSTTLEKDNATKHPRFAEFTEWQPVLNGEFIQGTKLAAVSRDQGKIDLFGTAPDGKVWTAAIGSQTAHQWAGWWSVGDPVSLPGAPVAAISRSKGVLDIFVTGFDGKIKSTSYVPEDFDGWNQWFDILDHDQFIPGIEVTAISRAENLIDLFAIDKHGIPYAASWNPQQGWQGWTKITTGQFTPGSVIAAVAYTPDHLDIFSIAPDGRVWTAVKGPHTNNEWAGWWPLGDWQFEEGANLTALTSDNHPLQVYVIGKDGKSCFARHEDNQWSWYTLE